MLEVLIVTNGHLRGKIGTFQHFMSINLLSGHQTPGMK